MRSRESRVESRAAGAKGRETRVTSHDAPAVSTQDSRLSTLDSRLSIRPAQICRRLLAALDATEGRRRRRKRNTTPDAIGISIKRGLMEQTMRDDPDPDNYEGWLLERCVSAGTASGPVRAMALDVLAEWRLAQVSEAFRNWLEQGAPSEDA
jgi:hypothetical protein